MSGAPVGAADSGATRDAATLDAGSVDAAATDAAAPIDSNLPDAGPTMDMSMPPIDMSAPVDMSHDSGPPVDAGMFPSPGCGTAHAPGFSTMTMTVRGEERSYLVHVLEGYDPNVPVPLHISFHGCGGDSMSHYYSIRERAGIEEAFGAAAVHVYPQGLANSGCPTGWEMSNSGKDVEFVDNIRTTISNQFCIDTRGMIVTGMSYGGDFTNKYACARPASVVVAVGQATSWWPHSDCVGPVAMVATYALGDPFAETYTAEGFAVSRDFWRVENGCSSTTVAETPSPCERYQGCTDHPLITCVVPGGDHGTYPDNLGVNLRRWYREQLGEIARP